MLGSIESQRRIGRVAWWMAWFGLVLGQLHAMARHQTADGKEDLESGLVRAWSDPAREIFAPLLGWASPDTVYLTYGKLWLPVFVAFTLCAFVVRRRRRPVGVEKWAWRLTLTAYVGACVSVALEYWTQWTAVDDALMDPIFLASLPFVLLTMVGSTFLGIVLLRRGVGLPAALLTLAVPGMILIPMVTSMGSVVLPIAFAFGILGRRIAGAEEVAARGEVPAAA
ncbi:hypothetical protein [Nocardioides sp. URHA0032]|uniref:hypothetical protein n=1 Tax=Nocardioides sp. URHA0032 TaxID=1380388 RepID=UPI00048AD55B|nr:hypothetical protein [Nocardioides sp. URHA0032]